MKTWRDYVRRVVPYTPGEQPNQPGMIKLNTNENPYPPAPGVVKMAEHLETDRFRLYPDPTAGVLTKALAEFYHVAQAQVFVGVGSDDVLADAFKILYETKALDENFRIRKEDYYGENGGVIFPNPNAPTSVYEDLDFVEDILKHNRDVLVIVDEAYIDFGGKSALALIEKYDNLLVVQTFSKSRSMAGIRIGYAIGNEELIKALNDFKYSFNSYTMNQTSLVLGAEAVKDRDYFNECLEKIMHTRSWAAKELKALGFEFNEPWANFIFATHPKYPAKELFEALRKENIYVRYFNLPRIDNYLRITVGTDAEMETLIHFLKDYMK